MSMDNRDEIIRTQMDVISTLVSNNLKNLADDIWGAPAPKRPENAAPKTPASEGSGSSAPKDASPTPAAQPQNAPATESEEADAPPEDIEVPP